MSVGVARVGGRARLERLAEGPRATLLVREHFSFVWRTLRRFGVSESDADDAAQRVFVIATSKIHRIELQSERAFLFGTAVRIADKVRRSSRRRREAAGVDVDDGAAPGPGTEELVDQRRARSLLDRILDRLTEELRTVFVLYEIEEMTTSEIAVMLGIPQGTVASRLRRARAAFQIHVDRVRRELPAGEDQ